MLYPRCSDYHHKLELRVDAPDLLTFVVFCFLCFSQIFSSLFPLPSALSVPDSPCVSSQHLLPTPCSMMKVRPRTQCTARARLPNNTIIPAMSCFVNGTSANGGYLGGSHTRQAPPIGRSGSTDARTRRGQLLRGVCTRGPVRSVHWHVQLRQVGSILPGFVRWPQHRAYDARPVYVLRAM